MSSITINEEVLEKSGLTMSQLLVCMLAMEEDNPQEVLDDLVKKGILIQDGKVRGRYLILNSYLKKIQDIFIDSDKEVPKKEEYEDLYYRLVSLFPPGRRDPNNHSSPYWKGNKRDTIRKLQLFIKTYGKYTEDQIYEATKHYVERMKSNIQYMRILPYFIGKFGESDLATELENMAEDSSTNDNWTETLC